MGRLDAAQGHCPEQGQLGRSLHRLPLDTCCPTDPMSLTLMLWDAYILEGKCVLTATAQSSGRTEASDPCARVGTVARGWL